jgi:hypothetical protein
MKGKNLDATEMGSNRYKKIGKYGDNLPRWQDLHITSLEKGDLREI